MRTLFSLLLALASLPLFAQVGEGSLCAYVDPLIGSADHGHVFVGANVPQGMVNLGPTQIETGWDWCSGYHYSGDSIVGFAHTHLSGTGCSDLGDIALMPALTERELSRVGLASPFRHETEEVRPGYYCVKLDRDNILCELTATERVGLSRFTFPRGSNDARVIIDLENGVGDRLRQARVYQVDDHTLAGYRISHGWTNRQEVYFTIEFSKPISRFMADGLAAPYAVATFEVGPGEAVMAKVGLSPVNETGARGNLLAEMPSWDFNAIARAAARKWNKELGRIEATFFSEADRRVFYTAMYHMLMAPQVWNDLNGDYMGADGRVRRAATFQNYTTWSLWDTYRALHPLATLIMRDRLPDYVASLLHIYEEQGELPVWHLHSNETYCMVGCPGVIVLADMLLKDSTLFTPEALMAVKESLLKENRSLSWMQKLGYVPYDKGDWEPVSKTLEYYIADDAAARLFGRYGMKEDSVYFARRSRGYKRLFDPATQCFRALDTKGQFRSAEGFNPCHQTSDYTEGNAWQYSFLVPHDVEGLVGLWPTKQAFIDRLDSLFLAPSELNADANPDISGLIGQYAHGNEISHHTIYLYNYVGQAWKTARRVREVMRRFYTDKPEGLCGNEDVGQMSAWYILSALGLYQVEPAGGPFCLGSPLVSSATLHVGEGRTFTITAHNNSDKNIYVDHVLLNSKPYPYAFIRYEDIVKGGHLEFFMSKKH